MAQVVDAFAWVVDPQKYACRRPPGLLWLTAIFVVAWRHLPDLPTPELGELPVPTVLAIGGAALGCREATPFSTIWRVVDGE